MQGRNDRGAEGRSEAALSEGAVLGAVGGLAGFNDVHFPSVDIQVALGGQNVAANLAVVMTRQKDDVATGGANQRGGGGGAVRGCICSPKVKAAPPL